MTEELKAAARVLLAEGWESVSNKYRTLARVPCGRKAPEFLREMAPSSYAEELEDFERRCKERILRSSLAETLELSVEEHKAFKVVQRETENL